MTRIHIFKTNRRIKLSPYQIACKVRDGKLGYITINHVTNVDDILSEGYQVGAGDNLKHWFGIADELDKPGVFGKLANYIKSRRVNRSGKPNSCICGDLPVPHSHLKDDGKSHNIRPDVSVVKKK